MEPAARRGAIAAAMSVASTLGLDVDRSVVLSDSNRLVLRLLPCDVVARIVPAGYRVFATAVGARRELDVVRQLAALRGPVAISDPRVEPRVVVRDGFEISFLAHIEAGDPRSIPPTAYARELERLHGVLRQVHVAAPRFTERVGDVQAWIARRDVTPDLADADRHLLADTLGDLRRSIVGRGVPEQVLHGEPHPWNVLGSERGPVFVDFENCVRGPLEFDLGWVPTEVSECYPGVDPELVDECRGLVLAIVAAHGWRKGDLRPGREAGARFLDAVRQGPPWPSLDTL